MGIFDFLKRGKSFEKRNKSGMIELFLGDDISVSGYTPLSKNPEVQICVNYIAELVSSMTIYLMENGKKGDRRIKDGLAYKIDVEPSQIYTRKNFIYQIVKKMLIDGNCIVYPEYQGDRLYDLKILPNATVISGEYTYKVFNDGVVYEPDEILNFISNPDLNNPGLSKGYAPELKDLVQNLTQAAKTKREFMSSKYRPPLIVRVDSMHEELSSEEGRRKIIEKYMKTSDAGEPWILPVEMFDVKEIRPLSLKDIAINESAELDKKTVARIIGTPNYVVGIGEFNRLEYRNFVSTKLMSIAQIISQEFTRKLLYSNERYFKFNQMSLYAYDVEEMANVIKSLYPMGLINKNESRDWVNLSPTDDGDEFKLLENYIPADMSGKQKKLKGMEGKKDE